MNTVMFRLLVHGKDYDSLIQQVDDKLSSFVKLDKEEIKTKFNLELNIFESNSDGITDPTYTAEVLARMRNHG